MNIPRPGNHDSRPSLGLLAIVALLVVYPCSSGAEPAKSGAPTSLRIVAQIKGKDELHISHRRAGWVNLASGSPQKVEINGRAWNPKALPEWQAGRTLPLLRGDIDLAGAMPKKLRGRGKVDLGYDARGLVVTFDDGRRRGADVYEVLIEFADIVCEQSARSLQTGIGEPDSVEISIGGHIDGGNGVRISPDKAEWLNYDRRCPELVTINGQAWNPKEERVLSTPDEPFYPRGIDVANAQLIERKGRGAVQIDRAGDELTIWLDDRIQRGVDEYLARVRIPLEALVRVEVQCDEPAYTAGAQLKILRFREGDTDPEIILGQRIIDPRGRCIAALPPGHYEFEVQTLATPNVLVSLRSGRVHVDSKQAKVRLGATPIRTTDLKIAGHPTLKLTDVGIRSILPTGDVSWRRSSPTQRLGLILSPNQTYRVRAMGSDGVTHAAVWKKLAARELAWVTDRTDQWIDLSFDWHPGTLPRTKSCVVFHFPETKLELPLAGRTRLLTNRRFVELGYWYELDNGRKVSFHRRGYVLPAAPANHRLTLGGPITGRAAAAVLQKGKANMRRIWCDVSAQDTAGHTLDISKSNVDWNWSLRMRDGSPVPEFPLSKENIARIGNPADTVLATATLHLDQPTRFELSPESLVPVESKRIRTNLPSYMTWRTKAYLAQAERILSGIGAVRDLPVDPHYKARIKWWMNRGAVSAQWGLRHRALGVRGSVTMPIRGMTTDFDWLGHPWGLSHELVHSFGYGHNPDMVRVDRLMKEHRRRFRWSVVDRPDFVPPELAPRDGPDG